MSYNSAGSWLRNAYYWEGSSFDACNGHPDGSKTWHIHINPVCLYSMNTTSAHSPLLGFLGDSYPIYGIYGYVNNNTASIARIKTSYRLRSITSRTTYANGTAAPSAGPAISSTYPLGAFIEDYEYVSGLGDLDQYNGRWTITPE